MASNFDGKIVIATVVDTSDAISDLQKLENSVSETTNSLLSLTSEITKSFNSLGEEFSKWTNSSVSDMVSFSEGIGQSLSTGLDTSFSLLTENCLEMKDFFNETFTFLYEEITDTCNNINSSVYMAVEYIENGFGDIDLYNVGKNIVLGLVRGMESQLVSLQSVVTRINNLVSSAMTSYFQIQSPSKLTTSYGEYIGQGLANGLKASEQEVLTSAANLSRKLDSGISKKFESSIALDISSFDLSDSISPSVSASIDTSSFSNIGTDTDYTAAASEKTVVYAETPITISNMSVRDDNDIYAISKELASLSASNMYSRSGTVSY